MRGALSLVAILSLFGISPAFTQTSAEMSRAKSRVDELINGGSYRAATDVANSMLQRLHFSDRADQAGLLVVYLGKVAVETGQFGAASRILTSAEALSSRSWGANFDAALLRERAVFYYEVGQYDAAVAAAAKAYKLSDELHYYQIRAAYCQSIQALALLRTGHTEDGARLALMAVKSVPRKANNHPLFAPRILYAACVVESHLGNYTDAEAYCRRGLEIAAQSKRDTRDLSLGYLALGEAYLQAGDLPRCHEAALKSTDVTRRLFGTEHQDMVSGLGLLAQVVANEGNSNGACARAKEAVKIATRLFGSGSLGVAGATSVLLKIEACKP
jgi:tetratricopeptide (TPR) repeat protein